MLRARDLMHKDIVGVERTTKVAIAAKLARSAKVSLLPVLDDGRLCGVVTDSDLKGDGKEAVGVVMKGPVFVQEGDGIDYVSDVMVRLSVGRIPVVDSAAGMECVGIITSTDIVNALKAHEE